MKARLFSLCTAAALVAAPLGVAHAQYDTNMNGTPSKYTVELYLAQYRLDTDATAGSRGMGGVGARVMFGRGDATKTLASFFNRARAGVYATYTGEQGSRDVSTFNVGGQADFPLFAAPVANGYLDPFVSLGAGIFHTSANGQSTGTNTTSNDFVLTPAVGALFPITGAIKFRGDLRDAVIFGQSKTTNNLLLEGGISVGF